MYHRIDGKLVGCGVLDILHTFVNSAYFLYDPEYSFLNLGVVGAIRELEFMRMAKKKFNPHLKYY
jgi:arginyl-tRNA---protein transferase